MCAAGLSIVCAARLLTVIACPGPHRRLPAPDVCSMWWAGFIHQTAPVQATTGGSQRSAATQHQICMWLLTVQVCSGGSRCQSAAAPGRSTLWVCLITLDSAAANFVVLCLCRVAEEAASARQVLHLGRFFSPMDVTITATTWKQRQLHIQFQSHRSRCACRPALACISAVVAKAANGMQGSDCQLLSGRQGFIAPGDQDCVLHVRVYGAQSCP